MKPTRTSLSTGQLGTACLCLFALLAGLSQAALAEDRSAGRAVLAWIDVAAADERYPLLADSRRGTVEREALLAAARQRGLIVRLAETRDAYRLGHVATETGPAHAPLRQLAGNDVLLVGTLTRAPDGRWDADWLAEDVRADNTDAPTSTRHRIEGATLDAALQAGLDLAARVPAATRR